VTQNLLPALARNGSVNTLICIHPQHYEKELRNMVGKLDGLVAAPPISAQLAPGQADKMKPSNRPANAVTSVIILFLLMVTANIAGILLLKLLGIL